jgi:hypothetical protein
MPDRVTPPKHFGGNNSKFREPLRMHIYGGAFPVKLTPNSPTSEWRVIQE